MLSGQGHNAIVPSADLTLRFQGYASAAIFKTRFQDFRRLSMYYNYYYVLLSTKIFYH